VKNNTIPNIYIISLLCAALLLGVGCKSTENEIESYQSKRSRILNELGYTMYEKGDMNAAMTNFNKALQQAESSDNRVEACRAHINIGQILLEMDQVADGEIHLKKAHRTANDIDDDSLLYSSLLSIGKLYYKQEKYEDAEEAVLDAVDIAEDLDSRDKHARALNDLGAIYQTTGKQKKAIETFLHGLFLYENCEGRVALIGKGSVSNNLAAIRQEQGRHMDAWDLYTNSLACYQQLGDKDALFICHTNMAKLLESWGKTSDALLRYERAYGVSKEIPHAKRMEFSLNNILRLCKVLKKEWLHNEYRLILDELKAGLN